MEFIVELAVSKIRLTFSSNDIWTPWIIYSGFLVVKTRNRNSFLELPLESSCRLITFMWVN